MWQKRSNILILLAVVASILLGAVSCENGCEQMRESFMHITFTGSTSRSLKGVSIDAYGRKPQEPADEMQLQYSTTKFTKYSDIELELNPNDSIVAFLLHFDYQDYGDNFQANDTVLILYQPNGRFLDMECGCTVDYEIKEIVTTHNLLEDIQITDPVIHTESGINLELIY